ncbi:hypothetical protein PT974_03701 [Cladobotryum mycophilum]|uniref:Uncharacterized protein n=1 Tax=Cladobotryum mycophilum TaxID=491253 RepID=A0ABR0SU85_9HYPO
MSRAFLPSGTLDRPFTDFAAVNQYIYTIRIMGTYLVHGRFQCCLVVKRQA